MKNSTLISFSISLIILLAACHETRTLDPQPQSIKISAPIVRNGYLVFTDYKQFLDLLRAPQNVQDNTISEWPVLNDFVSLEKESVVIHERFAKESLNGLSSLKPKDGEVLSVTIPILNKLVNKQGIIVIEDKLFSFSMEYVKILTNFDGSQQKIEHLLNSTTSNENEGLFVKAIETVELKSTKAKGARSYNSFNLTVDANPVAIFYPDEGSSTGYGFTYGHVRGYVNGVRTNYPVSFCPGPNGTTYVCGWDYSFSVRANADFYLDEYGTTLDAATNNISIAWSTDRGSGSGVKSVTICSSGSGMYGVGGVSSFSDIEGTVTFSLPVTVAGYTSTSTGTISL